ncbi:hypothetical protein HKK80_08890 [Halonotius sp. F2-221B]|mgnify:CR=1 FL=1|jgi:hypothetical protein|uniref:DUF7521 family protein n=1 Tax=Halonotius sp. F2-221B TaxID=2731620 RepID=UPI00398AC5D0
MDRYTLVFLVANATILVGSGTVALLARRAYGRTGSTALRTIGIGFACLGVGAATSAVLSLGAGTLYMGVVTQSISTAVAVLTVVYSLYQTSTDVLGSPPVDS